MSVIGGKADVNHRPPGGPLLAEGVEELGAIENYATFDQVDLVCGHNDSIWSRVLDHCFNFLGPSEFFNSLG